MMRNGKLVGLENQEAAAKLLGLNVKGLSRKRQQGRVCRYIRKTSLEQICIQATSATQIATCNRNLENIGQPI
jgi:hypothetical protein